MIQAHQDTCVRTQRSRGLQAIRWSLTALALLLAISQSWGQSQWTTGSGGAIYYNGGNVGLGTTTPSGLLHLTTTAGSATPLLLVERNGAANSSSVQFTNSFSAAQRSTISFVPYSPGNSQIMFDSYYDSARGQVATNTAVANMGMGTNLFYIHGWSGQTAGSLASTSSGGASFNMDLTTGNVGIGTAAPQYKLAVNGTIGATEVVVTTTGWSDYVFQPGYSLMPLGELAKYIDRNHHLPDIPSSTEVQSAGVSVGDMQAKLLAKIEELTLHMIETDKRTGELQTENDRLRDRVSQLESGRSPSN